MEQSIMREYRRWAESPALTDAERAELAALSGNEKEIESRFFAPLSFGTAGLRGVLGMGLGRMNRFIVAQATDALARLICGKGPEAMARGCAVCHDCRHESRAFAELAASVLLSHGVAVLLFEGMRPTPELSFAIRHYRAMAGINITASHNPKEYNGYKVYWEDGAQLPPAEAAVVADEMERIDPLIGPTFLPLAEGTERGLLRVLGKETDEAFLAAVQSLSIRRDAVASQPDMKLVYTPFHGAGAKLVPEILRRIGYRNIYCVERQMVPDPDFSTVKSPNPENPESFALAIELAREKDADLILGTDPDADRTGVIARNRAGEYRPITGNQLGVLLTHYILLSKKERGELPENAAVIKTIVTTEMTRSVCDSFGVPCFDTFTGFKFMAELISRFEEEKSYRYLFAYEESYGYMAGDHARDKDAVTASMLIGEMAAYYRARGMSLWDAMDALYAEYGPYAEKTVNLVMPGVEGLKDMRALMDALRSHPPVSVAGCPVVEIRDYLSGTKRSAAPGSAPETLALSGMDVLYYVLEDDTRFIVRPSGTEPKIKVYTLCRGEKGENLVETCRRADVYSGKALVFSEKPWSGGAL